MFRYCRLCSGTADCVQVLQTVFRYCRLCSGTADCVHVLQTVFRYCRLCSGTADCVQVRVSDAGCELVELPVHIQNTSVPFPFCCRSTYRTHHFLSLSVAGLHTEHISFPSLAVLPQSYAKHYAPSTLSEYKHGFGPRN